MTPSITSTIKISSVLGIISIFTLIPALSFAATTTGNLENIDKNGVVSGWVFDPDVPNQSISAAFILDGVAGVGTPIDYPMANLARPDVNAAYNITGAHGFAATIAQKYWDGQTHTLYVYGMDTDPNTMNVQTQNSPKTFSLILQPAPCLLDSITLQSGQSATFYSARTVQSPNTCSSVALSRTCNNGTLSGTASYQYGSCTMPSATPRFSLGFPRYTDAVTGNIVYQISSDPGANYVLYYHQYYFNDPDSVIIANLPQNDWRLTYYKINLRTGQKTVLSDKTANGELVKGNYFYGYNWNASPQYFGRQDITTGAWTSLYAIPSGWTGNGSVTVNSSNADAIFSIAENANQNHIRTYLLHLATGSAILLREEPASDGDHYDHYVFSPIDSNVFTFVNQRSTFGLPRIGVGTVASRRLQAINIQAGSGDYFDASTFGGSNFSHPVWSADGRLCSDILWHPQNPSGMYGFVCFNLGSDPYTPIPKISQELRFIPISSWNNHFKDAGIANWFVGDGDIGKLVDQTTASPYIDVLHMTMDSSVIGKYKTDVYNLAEIKGAHNDHRNAHVVANGDGVITTFDYAIAGNASRNVFLIETPANLQNIFHTSAPPQCIPNWSCAGWNQCSAAWVQTRACTDLNSCSVTIGKPNETQSCTYSTDGVSPLQSGRSSPPDLTPYSRPAIPADISSTNPFTPSRPSANNSCPNLNKNLSRGSRGSEVISLQRFFITLNLLTSDSATGYFGILTQGAVQRWQCQRGIVCTGSPKTTGYGAVGPKTRSALSSCNE